MGEEKPWIEWSGGECPVSYLATIDVKVGPPANGEYYGYSARTFDSHDQAYSNWQRRGYNDVIAYRVVKP